MKRIISIVLLCASGVYNLSFASVTSSGAIIKPTHEILNPYVAPPAPSPAGPSIPTSNILKELKERVDQLSEALAMYNEEIKGGAAGGGYTAMEALKNG